MEYLDNFRFDDPLFNMATVLIAGIIGGEIFALVKLPKVTGWIATGIFLRSLMLPGMDINEDPDALAKFNPFMSFVLGFIAFTVGATLYITSLRNTEKRIGLLLLGEATVTPLIIGLLLFFVGGLVSAKMNFDIAILLAAIGIAGAPGTTVLVIQEARAKGILTRTLIGAIGLIDMVAVGIFVFVSIVFGDQAGYAHGLVIVFEQFLTTFIIGGACAVIALFLTRTIVSPAFLGPTMVAVILGAWGAASGFGTSGGILSCTFAGIVVTNLRHDTVRSAEAYLNSIGGVLFALFFTLAGMRLDFSLVPQATLLVLLYFAARLLAKVVSSYTAMSLAGMPDKVRNYLGFALLPHGGVAVGLILLVQNDPDYADIESTVTTVGLAALAINQLLGPSATRFSLLRAGEDHKDRPQLLDFLGEQRILTDLGGDSKEEVIRNLSALLYSTSNISISREEFIQQVIKRDNEDTTCLGRGLMIPHAILGQGEEIKGVLGISSKGLDLGAPDGQPVHAVLLLATPESDRHRHLQVIAAFATFITRDVNFREQLYHARSPAHAYDVLHHDDQEDLNYFLADVASRVGIRDEPKSEWRRPSQKSERSQP
jgi:PTS system fructose-specific IIC component